MRLFVCFLIASFFILIIHVNGAHLPLERKVTKLFSNQTKQARNASPKDDIHLNVTQLITKYGYPVETHLVETEDGYILAVIRIPNNGPVVFVQHGLLCSADDFFSLGPHKALGYLLADQGYDVWLGNARGNKYSKGHVTLSPQERPFWNFTFHEIGYYDLPAMMDYALLKSQKTQLAYIGHSQGTTAFFVLTSERPEYNNKVNLMVSLATIAWLNHFRSPPLLALLPFQNEQYLTENVIGYLNLLPYSPFWSFITADFCSSSKITQFFCVSVIFFVVGFNYGQIDYTQLPVQIGHLPAGTGAKLFLHYQQVVAEKQFQQFNYGSRNIVAYGTSSPPVYPVEKITAPIAILYADNDFLSDFRDVQIFIQKAQNIIDIYKVPYTGFNHLDFLWARDAKPLVYMKILDLLKKSAAV